MGAGPTTPKTKWLHMLLCPNGLMVIAKMYYISTSIHIVIVALIGIDRSLATSRRTKFFSLSLLQTYFQTAELNNIKRPVYWNIRWSVYKVSNLICNKEVYVWHCLYCTDQICNKWQDWAGAWLHNFIATATVTVANSIQL